MNDAVALIEGAGFREWSIFRVDGQSAYWGFKKYGAKVERGLITGSGSGDTILEAAQSALARYHDQAAALAEFAARRNAE